MINHRGMGVIVVKSFFIISGYLMVFILDKKYLNTNFSFNGIYNFYLKRFLKIYPLHFLILLLWIIADLIIGKFNLNNFHIENVFIFGSEHIEPSQLLNPPIWSLSLELKFYLIVPFIFYFYKLFGLNFLISLFFIFLLIFCFDYLNSGFYKTYYDFFDNLYLFIGGIIIYIISKNIDYSFSFFNIAVFIIYFLLFLLNVLFDFSEILAIFLTFIMVDFFVKIKIGYFFVKIDKLLGDISYIIFLVHVFVGAILIKIFNFDKGFLLWLTVVIISMMASYFFIKFEKLFYIKIYNALRKK